ncbi:MAG: hypothetical protein IT378_25120 [Sandaracinaceae bacterium]|nr:hypothetical protein [Sandaracinaceae bacterium]
MSEELPELPPEVRELVAHERPLPALPAADVARMRARLAAALPSGGAGSPPPPGGGLGGRLAMLALGLVVGAAGGIAGTFAWLDRPSDRQPQDPSEHAHVEAPASEPRATRAAPAPEPSVQRPRAEPTSGPIDEPGEPALVEVERRAPPRPRPASAADSLARERRLLDSARTAIAGGHADEGIAVLERHAREFEAGALAEERDALWIRALLELGRVGEARMHAAGFQSAYPDSLFWPALQARLARAEPNGE